jgi:hypothetical protein
MIEVDQLNEIG